MPKKKKYVPRAKDDWNEEEAKEHIRTINEKQKEITEKYRIWWDDKTRKWKEGFGGH